jgi:signal peptidase I
MNIESLEIKLVKSSQIEDGDIIIIKVDDLNKKYFNKENIKNIYDQITNMINKQNLKIYFFPKNLDIEIVKNHIKNINEESLEKIQKNENEQIN